MVKRSRNIEVSEIIMPKIIIILEVLFFSPDDIFLGKDAFLSFFLIKKFENVLLTAKRLRINS